MNAINYAMAFFKDIPTDFYFLNVQKPSDYVTGEIYTASPTESTIYESVSRDNKKALSDLQKTYEEQYNDAPFSFESLFDFDVFTDALQQAVTTHNIDLIIMGTNGATNAAEVLFGSNTLHAIRNVNCPILAIPEGYTFERFASVLYTTQVQEEYHPDVLEPLTRLIYGRSVSLHVLCVDHDMQLPKSDILELFSEIQYHKVEGLNTPEAVSSYEQLLPVDMHAAFVKPKSFFERIFSGNEVAKISYKSKVPLLVLK